ncbi:MAG TPA: hypothetical protein DD416_04620 [Rhodobacteraceae bacterium]|nr:hypothetical protein [Paracoccaceae bacterium]
MTLFQIAALLIVLAGAFGSINYFFLRLPQSIGILVVALAASFAVMAANYILPDLQITQRVREVINDLHFSDTLLEGMLGLLLFAGALHVKLSDLRAQAWVIALGLS